MGGGGGGEGGGGGGGGGGGCGGGEEGEVEHEVSGGDVGGGPGQVEGEGYVVGLEGGEGCGQVGCAVGMAMPKLQMHHPLDAILRYIVVVEERVRYARDAEEQDAGCGEEEGAEVGSLGGLGDGGVDGDEGRFDCSGDEAGAPFRLWTVHQLRGMDVICLVGVGEARLALAYFFWMWCHCSKLRSCTGLELQIAIELVSCPWTANLNKESKVATMPKPRKSSGKPPAKPTASNASSTSPMDPPFKPAPAELSTFLDTLTSKSHIYILHLDMHPRAFKRRIFAVPLLLNIFILVILVFRLQRALPTYFFLLLSVLGYDSPANIDKENTNQLALLGISGERTLMFAGDFLLFRFVGLSLIHI